MRELKKNKFIEAHILFQVWTGAWQETGGNLGCNPVHTFNMLLGLCMVMTQHSRFTRITNRAQAGRVLFSSLAIKTSSLLTKRRRKISNLLIDCALVVVNMGRREKTFAWSRAQQRLPRSLISLYSSNRPAKFLIGTLPSRYTPKTIYMWGYKLSQPPSHCWAPWRWKFDYRRERVLLSPPEMGLSICQSLTWNSHHTRRDPNTCCMLPRRLPFYNGGGLRNQTVCEWEDSFSSSYFFLYDIPIGARTPGISWASFLSVSFGRPFSLHLCGNELIDKGNRAANRLFVWNMKKNKI